jgi:hypothetical protein
LVMVLDMMLPVIVEGVAVEGRRGAVVGGEW